MKFSKPIILFLYSVLYIRLYSFIIMSVYFIHCHLIGNRITIYSIGTNEYNVKIPIDKIVDTILCII